MVSGKRNGRASSRLTSTRGTTMKRLLVVVALVAATLTIGGSGAAQPACPSLYIGQWTGVGHSSDQDLDFTLLADIAFTDDQLVGFMRVFGDVTVEGSFVGTVDCATFSAT